MAEAQEVTYRDFKKVNVPSFSGLAHEDANSWIQIFVNRCTVYDIPNLRKIALFKILLGGAALRWFQGLTPAVQGNWEQTLAAFQAFYISGGAIQRTQKLAEFHSTQQGFNTVRQFYDQILQLSTALGLDADATRSQFMVGLNPAIRDKIILFQPATIAQALELAETAQGWKQPDAQQTGGPTLFSSQVSSPQDPFAGSVLRQLDKLTALLESHVGDTFYKTGADIPPLLPPTPTVGLTPRYSAPLRGYGATFRGRGQGFSHRPQGRDYTPRGRGQNNLRRDTTTPADVKVCYYCQGPNHLQRHCQLKKQHSSQQLN